MAMMLNEINELLRSHVKERLSHGDVVASMTVRLVRGIEIARIAKSAGFDSLYVDLEHSSFSLETTGQICIAALEAGITPLVRVPGLAEVSRVLDAGALGVIAPHVQSADDARAYVAAAKFPPLGHRSAAGPLPHLHYLSFPAASADAALNQATLLIVQFESEEALPVNTSIRGCAMPMPGPLPRAASTASMWASAALPRAPTSPANSCAWAPVMSRPEPISASSRPPAPPRRRRCTTSSFVRYRDNDVTKRFARKAFECSNFVQAASAAM